MLGEEKGGEERERQGRSQAENHASCLDQRTDGYRPERPRENEKQTGNALDLP